MVQGQYDEMGGGVGGDVFLETKTVRVGAFTIGLIHGHQVVPWGDVDALAAVQRKMNADVLVVGHRGAFASHAVEDRLILFRAPPPAWRASGNGHVRKRPEPSFVLMDVAGDALVAYVYELENGKSRLTRSNTPKNVGAASSLCRRRRR